MMSSARRRDSVRKVKSYSIFAPSLSAFHFQGRRNVPGQLLKENFSKGLSSSLDHIYSRQLHRERRPEAVSRHVKKARQVAQPRVHTHAFPRCSPTTQYFVRAVPAGGGGVKVSRGASGQLQRGARKWDHAHHIALSRPPPTSETPRSRGPARLRSRRPRSGSLP
ncbi:hypothetical protein BV22DRAFT_435728 [Leucogyrophana mollusca]|uniref:Uncharacterized protein n=1 Tax=Leucogyrophana mollusca TaxID=85980 RepID=A0ACB8BJ27_9AGAM|nr:hypothetical protein BV22DRAFT_435728 [Leucogyrophana mollusca]